ncbi:MAG TPA: V4R domain-containing protein [Pseudoxanthomonas sp.]
MAEIELKIVSDHRDGLLIALGEVLVANRFLLLRHRRMNTDAGVLMSLVVQGPEANLLTLEEQLGTHWMVKSLEAGPYDPNAAAAPLTPPSVPVASASLPPAPAPPAPAQTSAGNGNGGTDKKRIEALLPQVARDYPQIFGAVMGLERNMEPSQREASMRYVGARVGAWVYKRDFALGARLPLSDSIKHIALPAMRQLLPTELEGETLSTGSSPFCVAERSTAPQCHFLRGFLEGSLNECGYLGMVRVSEVACRANGSDSCKFVFHV